MRKRPARGPAGRSAGGRRGAFRAFLLFSGVALCVCAGVLVLAFAAFVLSGAGGAAVSPAAPAQAQGDSGDSYNLLFATADDDTGRLLQCLLIRLDTARARITVAALPPDLVVETAAGRQTLTGVNLAGGMSSAAEKLRAQYGLPIRFTCLATRGVLSQAVDGMGGIVAAVPSSCTVLLPDDAHPAALAAGRQLLNGKKTAALISSVSSAQSPEALSLQAELMRDFLAQKLTATYTSDPAAFYRQTLDGADTRFAMSDLLGALSFVRSFRAARTDFVTSVSPGFGPAGGQTGGTQLTQNGRALLRASFGAGR